MSVKVRSNNSKKVIVTTDKNSTDLIDRDTTRVIATHQNTVLENDTFDRFMEACSTPQKPNKALVEALKNTRRKGF